MTSVPTKRTQRTLNSLEHSQYHIDIINESGLQQDDQTAIMQVYSMTYPLKFVQLKQRILKQCVEEYSRKLYYIVWKLFAFGKFPNGKSGEAQIVLEGMGDNGGSLEWSPEYARSKCHEMASELTMSMIATFRSYLDEIMPDDFTKLAHEKIKMASATSRAVGVASKFPDPDP